MTTIATAIPIVSVAVASTVNSLRALTVFTQFSARNPSDRSCPKCPSVRCPRQWRHRFQPVAALDTSVRGAAFASGAGDPLGVPPDKSDRTVRRRRGQHRKVIGTSTLLPSDGTVGAVERLIAAVRDEAHDKRVGSVPPPIRELPGKCVEPGRPDSRNIVSPDRAAERVVERCRDRDSWGCTIRVTDGVWTKRVQPRARMDNRSQGGWIVSPPNISRSRAATGRP